MRPVFVDENQATTLHGTPAGKLKPFNVSCDLTREADRLRDTRIVRLKLDLDDNLVVSENQIKLSPSESRWR